MSTPNSPEEFIVDASGMRQGQVSDPQELIDDRIGHLEWDVTEDVPDSLFGRVHALELVGEGRDKDVRTLYIGYWVLLALYGGLVLLWIITL